LNAGAWRVDILPMRKRRGFSKPLAAREIKSYMSNFFALGIFSVDFLFVDPIVDEQTNALGS